MSAGRKPRLWATIAVVMFGLLAWGDMLPAQEAADGALSRALSRVDLFAGLTDSDRDALKSVAALRRVQAGTRITKAGQTLEKLFIVMEGPIEVWVNGGLVTTLSGPAVIGETEFLNRFPIVADVIIQHETDVIELDLDAITDLMEKEPRIGYVLMRELAVIEAVRLRDTTMGRHAPAEQEKVAIDRVRLDFNAAYGNGDARAIAELLDPHAVWMPPGEPALTGRENIRERYERFFTRVSSTFELKAGDIRLCGDWAFLSGDWNRGDTPKSGGAAGNVAGHYLMVLKKQPDGAWKITRDIWNILLKP